MDYFAQFAYAAAIPIVATLANLIKSFFDWGNKHWLIALGLGVGFGAIQAFVYPLFNLVPIMSGFWGMILVGLGTGFAAVGGHAINNIKKWG
jgi:hypothetical protein